MEEVGVLAAIGGCLGEDFCILTEDLDVVKEGPDVSNGEVWGWGRRARLVQPFVMVGGLGRLEGLGCVGGWHQWGKTLC